MLKEILIGLLVASNTVLAGAEIKSDTKPKYECDITYGVVLDIEKNGRVCVDADPTYNYISYKEIDANPGEVIKTYTFINEYGEIEYRFDKVCPISIDRYEGDDRTYAIFEILDGNDMVMGEIPLDAFPEVPDEYTHAR